MGRITPNLQLAVGYTYNDNENKRQDDAQFSTITPRHLFKAWADYRMTGAMRGWSLGAGVVAQSSNFRSGASVPTTRSRAVMTAHGRRTGSPRLARPSGLRVWAMPSIRTGAWP
jgi:outer membrane receptor for ferric coprogen and ferric-rhodotorulic acid